jgi:choline dehydrogenase-like flavoprotein
MIRVLAGAPVTLTRREADVLVVGGGIAGLLIATRIARAGKRVIVFESGGTKQEGETHPLNQVTHLRSIYSGATNGRFRCLGGTSTRWGGAMIPMLSADLTGGGWPINHAELMAYLPQVERLFTLSPGGYDDPDLSRWDRDGSPTHLARFAKWPPFRLRNVARLFDADLRANDGPEVWLHATATRFAFKPDGWLESIEAEAPDGRRLLVNAKWAVIAAGAIESTRLLLLADRQHDNRIFAPDGVLGRYFHDHLSVMVGRVLPSNRRALNRTFGFRFEGRCMRNLRFELAENPEVRARVPPGFAHVSFSTTEGSGFDALRALYRALQQGRPPDVSTLARLAKTAPWLARAAWWRFTERRLLYPSDAIIELQMVIEQHAVPENRILLSDDLIDDFGQPLAAIDWDVSPADHAALALSIELFCNFWTASPLSRLAVIERRPLPEAASDLAKSGGVYHPCGSARMGSNAARGVVDNDFRVFRVPNLSLVSTAAFPTAGGANPTMMLMMAALRAADQILHQSKLAS